MCPLKCGFCGNRLYKREYIIMDNSLFENLVKQYCDIGGFSYWFHAVRFFVRPFIDRKNEGD